ncbi:DUF1501 domain-containing protein [Inhella gelatinilytica]|uniref:DUF1501 domain-containing protein n=1 Tax=Inhella gelatinilytica TaxID=2795030 RepID=A0A931IWY8_9BURK|nr:DUF1501 domain-containing protein [Inhella gelatinilytica]MBH9554362.1 DUF1501 domain-containing protein [Inhella gelatinilytica]
MSKTAVDLARRAFLRRAALTGVAGAAAPWALNLSLIGEAAAATNPSDYKALVCVFLYGGNDNGNTLIPADATNHAQYATVRSTLALPQSGLVGTTLTPNAALPGGLQLALNPAMAALMPLWDAGQLAVQLNVGPLIAPTTLAQYNARSVPLPPKLFSHNDQQSIWQSDLPEGAQSGWGGRIGDLMLSGNGGSVFSCISVTGNSVFLTGKSAVQYQMGTSGAVAINGISRSLYGSAAAQAALRNLITASSSHLFEAEYSRVTKRSIDAETQVTAALAGLPELSTPFDANNSLANQLKMVARMIAARGSLGVSRQVFMVSLGGFDLHDNLLTNHPGLLGNVAGALASFQSAMSELGVADQVTAFTASDFGRTLTSNGDGSDHGWGSHHFVLGGAVRGKAFYGTAPSFALGSGSEVGQGRLLPTTSVDQFAGTLATWLGVSATDLPMVVPNLSNFSLRNLGFV